MVATVERGLFDRLFWSIEIAGERPTISSTSGFCICRKNCLAYEERDSTYLRWPSAKIVSKASEDFPEPERPVKTTILFRGISTVIFFKLWVLAPLTIIFSSLFSCLIFFSIYLNYTEIDTPGRPVGCIWGILAYFLNLNENWQDACAACQ